MGKRNLGQMGQSALEHWAHECGITVNPVKNDSGGWDHFLQFPHIDTPLNAIHYHLDMRPPELSCLVQVKATDKDKGRVGSIKLSNWERLVKNPMPAFYVVFVYNKTNKIQKAYLIHIDKIWTEKTLKKLRSIKQGDQTSLHKKYLSLTYDEKNKLSPLCGETMAQAILLGVGSDLKHYSEEKIKWIKNCGFEGPPYKVNVTLPLMRNDTAMQTLVDFAIGITHELQLDSLHLEEVRFGIPRSITPPTPPESIKLKIMDVPPAAEAEVRINDQGILIFRDCFNLFSPATVFPFIPFEYWKVRYINEYLAFTLSLKDCRLLWNINLFKNEEPRSLLKLARIALLIRHFANSNMPLKMEINRKDNNITIPFEINIGDLGVIDESLKTTLRLVENAWQCIKEFDLCNDIEITPRELYGQEIPLTICNMLFNKGKTERIEATIKDDANINLSSLAFLMCFLVVFGNEVFVISGAIEGEGKQTRAENANIVFIENGQAKCLKKRHLTKQHFNQAEITRTFDEAKKILTDEGIDSIITLEEGFRIV